MRSSSLPLPIVSPRLSHSSPESFHEALSKSDASERVGHWGRLSLKEYAADPPYESPPAKDYWAPGHKQPNTVPKTLPESQAAFRRDLRILGNPFVRAKTIELVMENPDTPFDVLSQVTLGGVSDAGLSHLAHRHTAKLALSRKRPAQRDPVLRVRQWVNRTKQPVPSRFQQEFLKQQQAAQKQAEAMDALQLAFRKLKLSD